MTQVLDTETGPLLATTVGAFRAQQGGYLQSLAAGTPVLLAYEQKNCWATLMIPLADISDILRKFYHLDWATLPEPRSVADRPDPCGEVPGAPV
jgi:hypothetical protein